MAERQRDITLNVAVVAALFCSLVTVTYTALQTEPAPAVTLFVSLGPLFTVILWLQKDSRRTGVGAVQDWGYFLWLAWPAVIPWYAFKTRGLAGWKLTAGLFALIGSPYLSALIAGYALWYIPAGR